MFETFHARRGKPCKVSSPGLPKPQCEFWAATGGFKLLGKQLRLNGEAQVFVGLGAGHASARRFQ